MFFYFKINDLRFWLNKGKLLFYKDNLYWNIGTWNFQNHFARKIYLTYLTSWHIIYIFILARSSGSRNDEKHVPMFFYLIINDLTCSNTVHKFTIYVLLLYNQRLSTFQYHKVNGIKKEHSLLNQSLDIGTQQS